MKRPSVLTELALTNQKLEFICGDLRRVIDDIKIWNSEKTELMKQTGLQCGRIDLLERENNTQWKRIDWLWRTVWGVVIAQVIMIILLFGAKFIPLIKI